MSRGFISAVTCTAADWLAHGDEVVAREPVGTVTLTTWPGEWRYVVGNPHWPAAWFVPWVNGSAGMAGREEFVRRALEGRWPTVRQWNLPPSETLTYGGHDVGLAAGSISVESEDIYLPIRPDIAERLLEAAEAGERDRRHAAWGARQTAGNRRQRRAAGRGR